MTTPRFEYVQDKRRISLKFLFQRWHETLAKYDRWLRQDEFSLTWVKERTQIGILAQAAGVDRQTMVLEEYSTNRKKSRRTTPGRADIYMDRPDGKTLNFEAKFLELSINKSPERMSEQIYDSLSDAMTDCETLIAHQEGKHIAGLVFIVPYLGVSRGKIYHKPFRQKCFDEFIACIRNFRNLEADFIAYHVRAPTLTEEFFTKYCRWVEAGLEKDGPYWEPGIAVVGKYLAKD